MPVGPARVLLVYQGIEAGDERLVHGDELPTRLIDRTQLAVNLANSFTKHRILLAGPRLTVLVEPYFSGNEFYRHLTLWLISSCAQVLPQ